MPLSNYIFNSDYQIDKVVFFWEGVVSARSSQTLEHGLSFTPLPLGYFSPTDDFIECNPLTSSGFSTDAVGIVANGTSITLTNTGSADQYVRVFGLIPLASSSQAPYSSDNAITLIWSSDYGYSKIFTEGTTGANSEIDHDLGYVPLVRVWGQANNLIYPISFALNYNNSPDIAVKVTENQVKFYETDSSVQYIYRIYYDKA